MNPKDIKALKAENTALLARVEQLFQKFVAEAKAKDEVELKLRLATRALQELAWKRPEYFEQNGHRQLVVDTLLVLRHKLEPGDGN